MLTPGQLYEILAGIAASCILGWLLLWLPPPRVMRKTLREAAGHRKWRRQARRRKRRT